MASSFKGTYRVWRFLAVPPSTVRIQRLKSINPAHPPASAEGARLRRFFAAALDASATASLILSKGRNHAPVSTRPTVADCGYAQYRHLLAICIRQLCSGILEMSKRNHLRQTAVRGETRENHAACRSTSQPLQANSTVRGIGCLPLA